MKGAQICAGSEGEGVKIKPETVAFVRGGMLFLEHPVRWRVWQRDIWKCCGRQNEPH